MKTREESKKKRVILAVSAVGLVALIGGTIAYNQNATFFNNLFHLGDSGPEDFIEQFESPANWSCQESVPKIVQYKNRSGVTRIVRIKYEEYWKQAGSTSTDHQTELPLENNGVRTAIVNLDNTEDWILQQDGYYYYKYEVPDGIATSEFMESVTFNCDFAETEQYTCQDTATGRECESSESDYMNANYHVYVTIQTQATDKTDWPYTPTPSRDTLYDIVASQTRGLDTNIDFTSGATVASGNGNGVNTLAAHANDAYPVYYYRGEVDNNIVIFANSCWRIVRTAEKGSVKVIYYGPVEENNEVKQCRDLGSYIVLDRFNYNNDDTSPADVGYMYGERYTYWSRALDDYENSYEFGNDVSWDGTNYTLINTISGTWASKRLDVANGHHYFCLDGTTTCSNVGYITYFAGRSWDDPIDYSVAYFLYLSNGENIENVKQKMFANTNDSYIKQSIESWFSNNLAQEEGKLEDVIYCNDRSIYAGSLKGKDENAGESANYFGAYGRLSAPSVDCANKNDAFTKANPSGNQKLNYKVGLITADEVILAGASVANNPLGNYLSSSAFNAWTMSPNKYKAMNSYMYDWDEEGLNERYADDSTYVRPSIALKHRTYVKSGSGLVSDPYILEWDE